MQTIADMVYTTIFSYIAITGDLIGCNNLIDYKNFANYTYLVIQKVDNKMMINLDAEEFAVYINYKKTYCIVGEF